MTHKMRRLGTVVGAHCQLVARRSGTRVGATSRSPQGRAWSAHPARSTAARTRSTWCQHRLHRQRPDGNSVFMWSYATRRADAGHFQSPGPVLCATQGQTITVNLTNTLTEATSIVFPGQARQ